MALAPGTRLGPYEVTSAIGAGGMGEVYRAKDRKLNRDVALKVLPDSFANDGDRLARFTREAQTLAALNHPNIAAVYGLEQHALVMELVEGDDLSAHIARGPIALDDTLAIARQIADALEAAHESGIVHRDLKPANVKVRPDGTVKVLDFGLAKALGSGDESGQSPSTSPTLTARATQLGMIIGTAAYMAPEQARGRPVDRRADIWAFGVVLYEMLSGRRAFDGDDVSITLAGVLKEDVKWDALPSAVPAPLRTLLRRCLEKNPKRRLGWIGEARVVLDDPAATSEVASGVTSAGTAQLPAWRRALPWSVAALAVAAALGFWLFGNRAQDAPAPTPRKVLADIGVDASLFVGQGASAILSPDGNTLVFTAGTSRHLYVRRLDQLQAVLLAGTEGAANPFFSPKGDWIGFFTQTQLKKVALTGGAAVPLCDTAGGRGATWLPDDTIIFNPAPISNARLLRVSASGGKPEEFGKFLENGVTQRWPQVLPTGTHIIYTESNSTVGWDAGNVVAVPIAGGEPSVLVRGAYYARYVAPPPRLGPNATGHLIFMQQGTVFAAPFDVRKVARTGPQFPAFDGVSANSSAGGAQYAVSAEGTLVFLPGTAGSRKGPMSWATKDGKTTPLWTTPVDWSEPRFSPDGTRVATVINDGKQTDIFVYEWSRDTATQLTFEPGTDRTPVWSPDGTRLVFASDRAKPGGPVNLYMMNADGTGSVTRLTDSPNPQIAFSWHPTKPLLFFQEVRPTTANDLMVLPLEGDAKQGWKPGQPTVFLSTPDMEVYPRISPDGRFLSYQVAGSPTEIFVRPFPGPGLQWRVTTPGEGGSFAQWSATTRELLFVHQPTGRIMVAPYTVVGDSFRPDKPREWTSARITPMATLDSYALHPDGKRVGMMVQEQGTAVQNNKVVFFFNFSDYLRSLTK
jgi:serine/threonine-protein kinase